MCRALTHSNWVRPLSPAPSARLAARTRRAAAAVSSRLRAAATRVTVTLPAAGRRSAGRRRWGVVGRRHRSGRGTGRRPRGVVSARSIRPMAPAPRRRRARRAPGGRREAGTSPWCRTWLCRRPVAAVDRVRDNGGVTDLRTSPVRARRRRALRMRSNWPGRPRSRPPATPSWWATTWGGAGAGGPGDRRGRSRGAGRGADPHLRQPGARLRGVALGGHGRPGPRRGHGHRRRGRPAARRPALLAPAWVPWHERLRPGDLSVGDVLPSTEDDPRLVPAYMADDDSAEDPEGRVVAFELGLGRERVMSAEGRGEAWAAGRPASSARGRRWPGTRPDPAPPAVLAAAGRIAAPVARRLRQRLRTSGRTRRHRGLRLRRPQPGHAGGRRAHRGGTSARYDTADFDVLTD